MGDQVREIVAEVLPAVADAEPDATLRSVGLDSIGVVRLVRLLERTCKVTISPAMINQVNFSTVESLRSLVHSLQQQVDR